MFHVFRGHPGLLVRALPGALVAVAVKAVFQAVDWQPLQFSPLLTGVIAAEVFIIGFLLSGTTTDFKEAEHLPGDIAASLETMADEFLIASADLQLSESRSGLDQLAGIARAIRSWLAADHGLDDVLTEIRALNGAIRSIEPKTQAGAATRIKTEQAAVRARVLRMDTLRRTSFVSSAYLIGEVTGVLLVVVLLLTNVGANVPTLAVVGLISFLLFYLFVLIRDLDNPFKYPNGKQGPADVPVDILERTEDRFRALLASEPAAPPPVTVTEPKAPAQTARRRRAPKKVVEVEPADG
jgi:DNA-binding FrmR family transcriptional regulator